MHGCGGVGLAAVQIASALGAQVVGIDISKAKLQLAEELGAVHVVDASTGDAAQAVRDLTGGGAHVAVDALGEKATCLGSIRSLRSKGRHLQIGMTTRTDRGEIPLPIDLIVLKELEILGSVGVQAHRYQAALDMVEAGKLDPGKLVMAKVRIEDVSDVIASMGDYQTLGITIVDQW